VAKLYCLNAKARKRNSIEAFPAHPEREMDCDVEAEEKRVADGDTAEEGVVVEQVRKQYPGGQMAVDGVSFGIPFGECFGLLGPNGAGKTTLISALSGTAELTSGHGRICGLDVKTQMSEIHTVLGVCPQFDIVWDDLTVCEHLLLYARIKGVENERVSVRRVAEAVKLDGDAYNTRASRLSGGMRRRLSLAIALISNPRVLFLDEPSTGLDPETRQSLWTIVARLRKNRCIVLTTHSMEEADALSQRIGIMAQGSLRCLGSPLHLKNKLGKGYQLTLTLEDADSDVLKARRRAFQELVKKEVSAGAAVQEAFKGERVLSLLLPKEGLQLERVFDIVREEKLKEYAISEWSIAQTSLNEVFLRIVESAENESGHARNPLQSSGSGPEQSLSA
jgi:ABC-type multidrug transport system ATPase subunit